MKITHYITAADDNEFKQKAEQLGVECHILGRADSIDLQVAVLTDPSIKCRANSRQE